jgi:hypothetical protein
MGGLLDIALRLTFACAILKGWTTRISSTVCCSLRLTPAKTRRMGRSCCRCWRSTLPGRWPETNRPLWPMSVRGVRPGPGS